MKKEDWHAWRRGGIGSSDAPVILGVDDRRTRLQLWLEKVGRGRPEPIQQYHSWGLRLEDDIAQAYAERTGIAFGAQQFHAEHETAPFFRATVDGLREDGRIVEFKALGVWAANEFHARDGDWQALPRRWIVQVHHQMLVMDHDLADVAVFYPLELRVYTVPRSERLIDALWTLGHEFWDSVQADEPPRTLDARDHEAVGLAYPTVADYATAVPPQLVDAVDRYQASRDAAARVELLDFLADAEVGLCPDGRVLRRSVKTRKGYTVPEKTEICLTVEGSRNVD